MGEVSAGVARNETRLSGHIRRPLLLGTGHADKSRQRPEASIPPPWGRGRPSSAVIVEAGTIDLATASSRARGLHLGRRPSLRYQFRCCRDARPGLRGRLGPTGPLPADGGVGYREGSTFVCAEDSADHQTLNELLELQHRMGMDINRISVYQARVAEPALGPGCVEAVAMPGDHQIDPQRLCSAILEILGDRIVPTRASEVLFDENHRAIGLRGADGRS
ncbi:FAD-dependent oxidoreductase [Cutibacterium sp. V947]|uniref:FAD-dependent oxidoreductase n=1 Tax=unclassified Cutibacterium TaxID=2649671 RepID=UPI003EE06E1B